MGSGDFQRSKPSCKILYLTFAFCKMGEAQDAFIIFDEAYEGNDVDAFYLGDILGALGEKRIAFADFGAILTAVKADLSATGVKEDYIEGLKVFDKDGTGKVPLPEVKNVLVSLGEKLEGDEADKLCTLLGLVADDEDMIPYMEFIDKLLAATA